MFYIKDRKQLELGFSLQILKKKSLVLYAFKKIIDKYLLGHGLSQSLSVQTVKVSSTCVTAMILSALRLHQSPLHFLPLSFPDLPVLWDNLP